VNALHPQPADRAIRFAHDLSRITLVTPISLM
jgi:hypothetical protein